MKKVHLLLCFFLASIFSLSNLSAQEGNLVVFSPMGQHFHLSIDGKLQNPKPEKNVKVTAMPEGNCFVTLEFFNKDIPMLKQSVRVEANKEVSFIVKKEDGRVILEEYSSAPLSQIGAGANNTKQYGTAFNKAGVAKVAVDNVSDEPDIFTSRSTDVNTNNNTNNGATNGVYTGGEHASKRMGQTKITETSDAKDNSDKPDLSKYPIRTDKITYKTENTAEGGIRVVEITSTHIKELAEKDGQQYIKTKNEMRERVTKYTCVPMTSEDFEQACNQVQIAAASILHNATGQFKNKCLTGNQLKKVKSIVGETEWLNFVAAANPVCAEVEDCPLKKEEPVVIKEPVPVIEEPVVIKEEPVVIKEEPKVIEEPVVEETKGKKKKKKEKKKKEKKKKKKKKGSEE